MTLLHDGDLCVEHVADEIRVHAVDDHAQPRLEERIGDVLDAAFQRQDAFAARDLRKLDEELQKLALLVRRRRLERHLDQFRQHLHLVHAESREQTGKCAENDDHECRRVVQGTDWRTLQNHAAEDGEKS